MTTAASTLVSSPCLIKEIFPKVISVSRATDIPAFYSKWFMDTWRQGYCEWQNPFNANQRQLVNFAKTKAAVFWSKNPAPLMPYLEEIGDGGLKFYFQFTLNDYESEALEPGVPALSERLDTFLSLAKNYRVIWRYDPIILGDRLTVKRHERSVANLMKCLAGATSKLVFSFVDIYGRVGTNLRNFNCEFRAPRGEEMGEFVSRVLEIRDKLAPDLELATCAEDIPNLRESGVTKNSCIDPRLINIICGETVFPEKLTLMGTAYEKDKGQRAACKCAPSKDIGGYKLHSCKHRCVYCYAGHART